MKRREFIKMLADEIEEARNITLSGSKCFIIYNIDDSDIELIEDGDIPESDNYILLDNYSAVSEKFINNAFGGDVDKYIDGYADWPSPEERAVDIYHHFAKKLNLKS